MNEEIELYTWAKLKEFCNGLTDDQLAQSVKIWIGDEETPTDVDCAEELGDDHYYFPEHEYSCTKNDFDRNIICDEITDEPLYETLEDAYSNEEYIITPANRVYLHAFL